MTRIIRKTFTRIVRRTNTAKIQLVCDLPVAAKHQMSEGKVYTVLGEMGDGRMWSYKVRGATGAAVGVRLHECMLIRGKCGEWWR